MGVGTKIFKGIIAVLAIANLILLFGFGYEIPGINKEREVITNTESADVGKTDQSNTAVTTEYVAEGSTLNEETAENATTEESAEDGASEKSEDEQLQKCKVISKKNARIRSGPGTEYERITSVPTGTILTILGEENGWYHIQTEDNITGYISSELVELI